MRNDQRRLSTRREPHERQGSEQQLHVDWSRCAGRGLCHELFPELIGRDEWGYPLLPGGNNSPVREQDQKLADQAIQACPLAALRWRTPR
jgi:ferredoxin